MGIRHMRKRIRHSITPYDKAPLPALYFRKFEIGGKVAVKVYPGSKQRPDPRLNGRSGVVHSVGRRAVTIDLSVLRGCIKRYSIRREHLILLK